MFWGPLKTYIFWMLGWSRWLYGAQYVWICGQSMGCHRHPTLFLVKLWNRDFRENNIGCLWQPIDCPQIQTYCTPYSYQEPLMGTGLLCAPPRGYRTMLCTTSWEQDYVVHHLVGTGLCFAPPRVHHLVGLSRAPTHGYRTTICTINLHLWPMSERSAPISRCTRRFCVCVVNFFFVVHNAVFSVSVYRCKWDVQIVQWDVVQ